MSRRLYVNSEDGFMGYLMKDFQDAWDRYLPTSSAGLESDRIQVSSAKTAGQLEATISAVGANEPEELKLLR